MAKKMKVKDTEALEEKAKLKFRQDLELISHSYKLLVTPMQKNQSWTEVPNWQTVEHVHWFHTLNSHGKPNDKCNPIAGHFHEIKVELLPGEKVPTVTVGPAMIMVTKKVQGILRQVPELYNEPNPHTHEARYIDSHKFKIKQINHNAQRSIDQLTAAGRSIAGIEG